MDSVKYWWILAYKEGNPFIVGPYETDVEAHEQGKKAGVPYSLRELPTRDENRATRMVKAGWMSPEVVRHGNI